MTAIPRIIHQTWKSDLVPMEYRGWQDSWMRLNPGFAYRLWTDRDLDALVAERFPQLLALYHGYRHPICRVDLGRYLVLKTFGGVYADLDCECLRPIDDLLIAADFAIGLEPESHVALGKAVDRGLSRILCPSFIASIPDHPFWDRVLDHAAAAGGEADILDATGPFLLTRAFQAFPDRARMSLLSPDLVYPVDKQDCATGRTFDIEFWERATRGAYVVHYWAGTWWRRSGISGDLPRDFTVRLVNDRAAGMQPSSARPAGPPKISCMMLAGDRTELAKRSIRGFLDQSYPDRELIVVDTGRDDTLEKAVRGLPDVHLLRPGQRRVPPNRLYAQAAEAATGDFLCFWEDHCLHDPQRLEFQWAAIEAAEADASLVMAPMIWQPLEDRIFVAKPQKWASSLMCDRKLVQRYIGNGASAANSIDRLLAEARLAGIDVPRLMVVTIDTADMQQRKRWDVSWDFSRKQYAGLRSQAVLTELSKRLPLEDHPLRAAHWSTLPGLDLFGRLSAASGLGTAARSTGVALASAGMSVRVHDIEFHDADVRIPFVEGPQLAAERGDGGTMINLVHANPETLAEGLTRELPSLASIRDRFTIGYWVWEAARIPARWRPLLPLIDEIWVPSRFVAEMIGPELPVPVVVMPHAVTPPAPDQDRFELGLPAEPFLFLFMFDALSTLERKNPIGLIQSYLTAFPEASDKTMLVIKTKDLDPDGRRLLKGAIAARDDILLIAESYTEERTASLIASCDCYVSLHRAEGFGLGIAEAMYFGKPVIATGHSGNMDFMAADRSYPVPYRMRELGEPRSGFPAGTSWAEPDLAMAAKMMRAVVDRPDEAVEIGRRGAQWVRTHLSPEAVGARMKARIAALTVSGRIHQTRLPRAMAAAMRTPGPSLSGEKVLILTPVKNAEAHLPRYFALLDRLEYDPAALSVAFLEGDSSDRSFAMLNAWAEGAGQRFRRVRVLKHDYEYQLRGRRWDPVVQRQRREILARSRNRLLTALDDEHWVLWLDADLVDYPPDLLTRLLAAGKEIVVPHSIFPNGRTFDLNSFRIDPSRGGVEDARYLLDGLFQPPRGEGRLYTDAFRDAPLAPLDSVGGTALLVRADLHREGLIFPAFGYRGYIETEGLAMMAKDMGVTPYALPGLSIQHAASSSSQES